MFFTFRYCVGYFLIALLVFKAEPSGAQPLLLNKHITAKYSDIPVSELLRKLGKDNNIRFSYDPEVVSASRKVSLNAVNQPLGDVLKYLFGDAGLLFRELGNQIVIYRERKVEQIALEEPTKKTSPEKVLKPATPRSVKPVPLLIPDTVIVTRTDTLIVTRIDTLLKLETRILHDTILHLDTVFIEKSKREQKTLEMNDSSFNKDSRLYQKSGNKNGFYGGISYEQLAGKAAYSASLPRFSDLATIMKEASSATASNFSVGFTAGYDYHRLGVRSGLSYTRVGESFQYSFIQQEGGYFKKDTVEQYYTLSGADTSWYYLTDSSWVNLNTKKYTYKNPNSYRYVEIPIMLKIRIYQAERAEVYGIGGIIAGIYFGGKALTVLDDASHTVTWINSLQMNPFVLSWQAGAGYAYAVSERLELFAEFLYRKQLTDQFKNYPVQKKFGFLNIKTGIFVRF